MSYIWRPGVQCVCINDDWPKQVQGIQLPKAHPIKGPVYDVAEVAFIPYGQRSFVGLILMQFDRLYYWRSDCFRPVKKTDISIFTKLLESKPTIVGVDEDIFEVYCDE